MGSSEERVREVLSGLLDEMQVRGVEVAVEERPQTVIWQVTFKKDHGGEAVIRVPDDEVTRIRLSQIDRQELKRRIQEKVVQLYCPPPRRLAS